MPIIDCVPLVGRSNHVNTLILLLCLALLLVNPVASQAAPPKADAGPDRDMVAGGSITLQGQANDPDGDPIIGWHWELGESGNGSPASIAGATTPNPTFTAKSPGLYVLTLVVDNGVESSKPDIAIVTVAHNRQPVAVAEADQISGPSPLTVNLDGIESTDPDFQPLTYYWDFGDGAVGEGPAVTHQYSIPGTYLVTLLVADDNDAVDLATLEILVTENDSPPAADAAPADNSLTDDSTTPEVPAAAGIQTAEHDMSRVADAVAVRDALDDEIAASENSTAADLIKDDPSGLTAPATDPAPGIDPAAAPASVQFDAASYSVAEDGTTALVWVTRTGNSSDTISVNYATDDFTATTGNDYTATSGTLSFAEGVIIQPVRVPILNDSVHEKNESFVLFLYDATGGASLEAQRVAFVYIIDNDAVTPDPTPVTVTDPVMMTESAPPPGIVVTTQCTATSSSEFARRERNHKKNVTWTINLQSSTDRAEVDALANRSESLNILAAIQEIEIDGTRYGGCRPLASPAGEMQ